MEGSSRGIGVAKQDWRTGEGYPDRDSLPEVWHIEFLRRGPNGFSGHPRFILPDGSMEFFTGPAIIQIESDGSLLSAPDASRTNATHMVIEFNLKHNIDAQLSRAGRWLTGAQKVSFKPIHRKRIDKYQVYLRAFDAHAAGASQLQIAAALYPRNSNKEAAKKQVSNDLKAARKLVLTGIPLS